MGALHAGHVALIEAAKSHNDSVVLTIFVNPTQFSNSEDLENYPRPESADIAVAEAAGVNLLVLPSVNEIWPVFPPPVNYQVGPMGERYEGADRPGHFTGVAQVVRRLVEIIGECRAYFGEKDFQQVCVIREMVRTLDLDVEIQTIATVREENGLALASRNIRLSAEGKTRALSFSRALREASETSAEEIEFQARQGLESAGVAVAYAAVVDNESLQRVSAHYEGPARLLLAGEIDGVRLIDNGPVVIRSSHAVSN
jgi:pantoate--beta-alanine ligase